jgi:hypothetical protein
MAPSLTSGRKAGENAIVAGMPSGEREIGGAETLVIVAVIVVVASGTPLPSLEAYVAIAKVSTPSAAAATIEHVIPALDALQPGAPAAVFAIVAETVLGAPLTLCTAMRIEPVFVETYDGRRVRALAELAGGTVRVNVCVIAAVVVATGVGVGVGFTVATGVGEAVATGVAVAEFDAGAGVLPPPLQAASAVAALAMTANVYHDLIALPPPSRARGRTAHRDR